MRASLPARLLVAALAALIVVPVVPTAPARAAEATTTTVASSKNPSTYGESVSFTATVTPAAAAGMVIFTIDTVPLGDPVEVVDGRATSIGISSIGAGTHAVTAAFESNDPVAYASSSGTLVDEQTVNPAALAVVPDPVTVPYGSVEPSYPFTVTGFVPGESAGTAAGYTAPACDSAYTSTTPVASSPLSIACSGGTASNYTFSYHTASLAITKADQSITFTSTAPAGATVGGTYTPDATATSGLAVAFTVDPASASACSLGGSQVAFTGTGTCTILANQAGDANRNPAPQEQQSFGVGQAATATALGSAPNPSTYGESVTFTATVAPTTATGTVTISDGATTLGACDLVAGSCTVSTGAIRAGTRSIVATYTGDVDHAGSASSPLSQVVNAKALTVTGITASNKVYDGLTSASINTAGALLVGVVDGDSVAPVTGDAAGTFLDKHVGTGKTVTVGGLTLSGADAANYVVTPPTTTASITPRALAVTATAANKTYDGTTTATVTLGDNRVDGDALTLGYVAASFADKNVGTAKTVTVTGIAVTGTDAGNYSWNATADTTASITALGLTVTADPMSKEYGDADPPLTYQVYGTLVGGDALTGSLERTAGENVGAWAITRGTLTAGPNYAIAFTGATFTITARPITVSATSITKVYDGSAASIEVPTITAGSLAFSDTAAFTQVFEDENVGPSKTLTPAGAVNDGNDGNNYAVTWVTATGSITARALTVTATGQPKVYDGTTTATVSLTDNRLPGDVLTLGYTTAAFASKHVGAGKSISVSGIAVTNADAGNYTWSTTATATASITPRPITVTAVPSTKVYDGTTTSSEIPAITAGDVVAGDTATRTQTYDTKTAGTGRTLRPAITILDGNDGNNYQVTAVPKNTGVIEAKVLTVNGVIATSRVYDGTSAAAINAAGATLVGRVGADAVTLVTAGATGAFATKDVGNGKTVNVAGLDITGGDAANYVLRQPTTTASITKASLTVRAAGSRPYGSANPPLPVIYAGFVPGETEANAGITGSPVCSTPAVATSVVGSYLTTCSVGTLSAANYSFTMASGVFTVNPAPLALAADPKSRQYGTPDPAFTATASGFVLGQTAALLTGAPTCSTTVLVSAVVGAYRDTITCVPGTLAAPNYAFTGPNVPGTLTVVPAVARPVVISSANPADATADVTFTASVTWPVGSPTGTVTFFEGATDLSGPVALIRSTATTGTATFTATFTTSWPAAGVHEVVAVYSGDGRNFARAAAAPFVQTVRRSSVNVVVTDAPAKWETNVPVTFTAGVQPLGTGVTAPVTGTVAFRVDDTLKATVPVVGGQATFTTKLALGARRIDAAFTPDDAAARVFQPGASAPLARTVVTNTVNASRVGPSSTSIFPVRDTWRDTVAIRGTRNERISVRISIFSPTGSRVRSVSIAAGSGPYTFTWNGRNSSGSILAAGKYRVVQVLRDAYGASRSYTSFVTLSRRTMTWHSRTITVAAGPRRFSVAGDLSILAQYSTTSTRGLTLSHPDPKKENAKWLAVGYQFTLPSASTYTSLSFQVRGSWTGTTAPKIGLAPWSGGDWFTAMYSGTRARVSMDTIATDWDAHTLTNLSGIRSGRSVRAVIDSFDPATGSGHAIGPYRYTITGVRLVVRYGILN